MKSKHFLWTDGRTFETHFIRSTRRIRRKNAELKLRELLALELVSLLTSDDRQTEIVWN